MDLAFQPGVSLTLVAESPNPGLIRARQPRVVLFLAFVFFYSPFLLDCGISCFFRESIDLPSFYLAAGATFRDHLSPYLSANTSRISTIKLRRFEKQLHQTVSPYLYPPPSLLFFYPLTLVSYETARDWIFIGNHVCLILLLYLLLFKIFNTHVEYQPAVLLVLLAYMLHFNAVKDTLIHGQIDIVVLTLICVSWYSTKKNLNSFLTAGCLAAAILLKTYPALLIGFLLIKKRYREAIFTVAIVVGISAISIPILPPSAWNEWLLQVLPSGAFGHFPRGLYSSAVFANQSINGITSRMFVAGPLIPQPLVPSPIAAVVVPCILCGIVVATTAYFVHKTSARHADGTINEEFAAALAAMYLVAPFSWEHHLIFVLPAVIVVIHHLISLREMKIVSMMMGLCLLLLAWPPQWQGVLTSGPWILLSSAKFFAVLLVWLFSIRNLRAASATNVPGLLVDGK